MILDLSLPIIIIAGQRLLPKMATEYPDLKIVICIADSEDKKNFANQPVVKGALIKPFTFIELKEIVGKISNDNQRQGKAG